MSEWLPIETAPKDELILVAHQRYGSVSLVGWSEYYNRWSTPRDGADGDLYKYDFFTHWMPLPEPPKPEGK